MRRSFGLLHPVHLSPHCCLQAAVSCLACLLIAAPCLTNPPEWRGVGCGGQARLSNAESNPTRLTHPIRIYPTAPSNPSTSSVYMSMSVTDRYTQSQTRLHKSVTELDIATALWRRNAANAHLAAVMGPSLRRHCRQSSSSYSVRDSILADRVVMSSLSTLSQSEQEIALCNCERGAARNLNLLYLYSINQDS